MVFDSYMPKWGYDGARYDGSDEMSDFDNETDATDEVSGDDVGIVGSKEGDNGLGAERNGDTTYLEELK